MDIQAHASGSSRTVGLSTALSAALACIVLLPLLGHRSLAMWDEGIYAEIAREMLHRSAIVPFWNYHPWFEKPPLLFWITAGFFRVFGVTEFWARAASALSGITTTAVLHHFLARRFGVFTAWVSSIILLSTFGFLHVCRAGEMDALLALCETIAVIGLVHIDEQRNSGWFLFWIGFAAALMTKGAASVVLPITLVCVAAFGRWGRRYFGRQFFGGLALFLAAVLPWHLAMWHRFGNAFTAQYLGMHVLERASIQIEGHYTHAWFYLLVLLVSAPPWVLLYPSGVVAVLRKSEFRRPELRTVRPLAVFSLVVLLLFTLVKTRLPHYIAPVYPALSGLIAVVVAEWLRRGASRWRTTLSRGGILVALSCVWALTVIVTTPARKELHSPRMADGAVTPDTHEPAALLKEAFRSPPLENGPLLLWAEPPIAPITTALFYSRRPVTQVEISSRPVAADEHADEYVWNPVPLEDEIAATPRLLLVEKSLLADVPAGLVFTPVASSKHWELGTIARRIPQP
jgi:4-amino-4-deoxy-L-arabinose transferase-like glycosyltransferase